MNFKYLFVNQTFKDVWNSLGVVDEGGARSVINSRNSVIYRQLRDLRMSLHEGSQPREIFCSFSGQYVRLVARCLAEKDSHSVFDVEIINLTNKKEEKKREQLDHIFRMMFALYDSIYLIHIQEGYFEVILRGASYNLPGSDSFFSGKSLDELQASRLFIHPDDQKMFEEFIHISDLEQRLLESEKGYLVGYFRTKTTNGAYVWKAHTMLYVPGSHDVIYCNRLAYFSQPGLIERVAPEYLVDSIRNYESGFHMALRQAIMESNTLNLFWKDTERRYVGANQRFLKTYGINDINVLLGKTDEELGWFVDETPIREDELRILKDGYIVHNVVRKCIIKGVTHRIMMCKEPIFVNGEIDGIVGFFVNHDETVDQNYNVTQLSNYDPVTGLLSAQGIVGEVAELTDRWILRRENFATIRIFVNEYHRATQTYGEKLSKAMLHETDEMISSFFANKGICARLFAGNFVVLIKCQDKSSLKAQIEDLKELFGNIRMLAGYPVTFNPDIELVFADEVSDLHHMIGLATGGTVLDIVERKRIEEKLDSYNLQMETIVNSIPGGIILYEIHTSGMKPIYASNGVGLLLKDHTDHQRMDILANVYEQDANYVYQAIQTAVRQNTNLNITLRIYRKDQNLIWVNMQGRVIGHENGNPVLLTIFHNMSDVTRTYEEILDEASVAIIISDKITHEILYQNQSAIHLINTAFEHSPERLLLAIRQADFSVSSRIRGNYEMKYENRKYALKLSDCDWNGRRARVCYVIDTTEDTVSKTTLKKTNRILLPKMEPWIHLSEDECPGLCSHFMDSEVINLFWKDKEGRYRGANKGYLKVNHIGIADLIGKTDDERNLYPDQQSHKEIEDAVLKNGELSIGKREKMIIDGAIHDVITTIEPVYHNGRIDGLLGYFEDLGEVEEKTS